MQAKMQPRGEQRYFIHDYRKTRATESMDLNQWKRKTSKLTENMTIVKWFTFRSPLKVLGPLGPCIMRLSSISPLAFFTTIFLPFLSLAFANLYFLFLYAFLVSVFAIYFHFWNRNFRIEHGFVVFQLASDSDPVYVSLEKLRGGFRFQNARSLATVSEYSDGATRGAVEQMSSSDMLGLDAMLSAIVSMGLILQSDEMFNAYYNLLRNNCQHTVSKLLECVSKNSAQLKFHIPGSAELVALNDAKALTFVERLYPKWEEGKVQQFPAVSEPFAFDIEGLPQPELPEHRQLLMKQRIVDNLFDKDNFEFIQGRKAVFSKLDKKSLKDRLNETALTNQHSAPTIIDQLTSFWNEMLDIIAVFEGLGVTIFHFPDEDNRDHVQDAECKMELVSKIGNFSNVGENSIHAVTITLADNRDDGNERVDVKPGKFGSTINISLPCDASDSELKEFLANCMKALVDSSSQSFLSNARGFASHHQEKPLQKFTAKLFLLQNMKNADFLIHKRIVKQEFGPDEFCVWTPKQEQIINEAREIFGKEKRTMIQWMIQGCFGSGKTLLLMQLVKEFFKSGKKGNVFIYIETSLERLKSLISSHFTTNGWEEWVSVGSQPESFDDVSLFLWDEFILFDDLLPFQKEVFFKLQSSNPSVVLFTSESETRLKSEMRSKGDSIGWMTNISMKSLGGNLRSSVEISNMTQKLQQHFVNDTWLSDEPVVSKLRWRSGQPTITYFHDNSDDRSTFLRDCKKRIKQLAETQREVMAVPLAHASFRAKLKDQCKDLVSVSFGSRDEILGHQYQCVIVVLDLASCDFLHQDLSEVMTRATTSLHFIINTSIEPFTIYGMPSIWYDYCLTHDIESRVRALIADVASVGKKVYDEFDVLETSFVEEIQEATEVEKRDLDDLVTGMELEEELKKFSLIIELMPHKTGVRCSGFWYAYFPPVIMIGSFDDKEDLQRVKNRKNRDLERHRKGILKFFMSHLKEGNEGGDGSKKDEGGDGSESDEGGDGSESD